MFRLAAILLLCAGCEPVKQPDSLRTVAAYEVPLFHATDKEVFLTLLQKDAKAHGFHVDAATSDDLKLSSEVSPITFNAAVWRGEDDDEPIAFAMDFQDRIGRVWLTFTLGQDPARSSRFRRDLVPAIERNWPETRSLPIMPNGGIPLTEDLVRTQSGYRVKPSAEAKYQKRER